jgi:oxygen-independent coproporphyrinogen-3 oxidase
MLCEFFHLHIYSSAHSRICTSLNPYLCAVAGIYIHIPFCKQACHYCDFHFSTSLKYRDEMVQAIIKEITLQKHYLDNETIETIYFGGGTPSLLNAGEINQIINTISSLHTVASGAEITLEANPDDLHQQQINALRQTPVNRFSIGIQSFFDEDLQWMNRAHRSNEAEAAVMRAQDAGFENITVDLIYGYPLLTDAKWQQNMDKVFAMQVPHVSAYSLTVEPRTALASFIKAKKTPPVSDQQSADQFMLLMDKMQAKGFEHYEISNFSRPGQYSRHNTNYWRGIKYLGAGPSAHSYNGDTRQWNIANNAKYLAGLATGAIPSETEVLTEENRLNEYIMTSLRTQWGLDLQKLESIAAGTKTILLKEAKPFFDKAWLFKQDDILTLTQSGKLYADHVAGELFF